ncbi:MAG: hypothetical protein HQL61_07075 [Magnetococcales bacterium]|nr:hypothetical protein [Nitrospirota bacterium]
MMKHICESLGLYWKGQYDLIKRDEVLSKGVCVTHIPSVGGPQETVCLLLKYLNGWLFKISTRRIRRWSVTRMSATTFCTSTLASSSQPPLPQIKCLGVGQDNYKNEDEEV